MFELLRIVLIYPWSLLGRRHEVALEVLALRHQITVLKRRMPKAKAPLVGSMSLGDVEESLARMENTIDPLPARDCHRLAASRIEDVLAMEVQAAAWATRKGLGIGPTHPPDVERQPDLG